MRGEDEGLPDVDGGIYVTMPMLLRIRGRRRSLTFTMETLHHTLGNYGAVPGTRRLRVGT